VSAWLRALLEANSFLVQMWWCEVTEGHLVLRKVSPVSVQDMLYPGCITGLCMHSDSCWDQAAGHLISQPHGQALLSQSREYLQAVLME